MKKRYRYFRLFWILLLYSLIILYTLVFPTTSSWFIFYAYTLWLLVSFLSTRQSYHLTRTNKLKNDDNSFSFFFTLENKRRQPYYISSIALSFSYRDIRRSTSTAVFFSKEIDSRFYSLSLPRGHHETFTLDIIGTGLFGVWKKHQRLYVPINIDVYPDLIKKSERDRMMQSIAPYLTESVHSKNHDYYMTDIRSFQHRDALAGIDWKTSLKRGEWMVKEYESEEETPITLYFLGFDSPDFEALLSLTYSLLNELKDNQTVNLFLLGRFGGSLDVSHEESGFLTIKPEVNEKDLLDLWRSFGPSSSKKIVITSKQTPVSSNLHQPNADLFINEDVIDDLKGGGVRQ